MWGWLSSSVPPESHIALVIYTIILVVASMVLGYMIRMFREEK